MKLLKDILYRTPIVDAYGSTNVAIESVAFDSRKVKRESLFVAVSGTVADGHQFIDAALKSGARAIVCEVLPAHLKEGITYVLVKDSSLALGMIAGNFYDNPSEKLQLIAITGTNGKTTTATLCHQLMLSLGQRAGLLSTVAIKINRQLLPATHTTPDPLSLNEQLSRMVAENCRYCFMEASSHGIVQNRMAGLKIAGAVFTNISHDHLDYHKTFDEYIKAKKKLFDGLSNAAFALVNEDDRHGATMLQNSRARKFTYGLRSDADFRGKLLEHQFNGMLLKLNEQELWTKLIGTFNVYNLTAVFGIARLLDFDPLQIATSLSNLEAVEGRFQYVRNAAEITAIIDYAHTPDALENVLKTIRDIRGGHENLITVVGCGGNRDRSKRPLMARLATEYSEQVIFTSDNPRDEDPAQIIEEMEAGVEMHQQQKYLSIENRREAIKTACRLAKKGDIILIAGKGHEKYQEIKGVKHDFDDMAIAREFLIPEN